MNYRQCSMSYADNIESAFRFESMYIIDTIRDEYQSHKKDGCIKGYFAIHHLGHRYIIGIEPTSSVMQVATYVNQRGDIVNIDPSWYSEHLRKEIKNMGFDEYVIELKPFHLTEYAGKNMFGKPRQRETGEIGYALYLEIKW